MIKKLTPQEMEFFQDPDEDFIPSESDDDDDDDESYLPEHDRRPYNRSNHFNGTLGRGKIDLIYHENRFSSFKVVHVVDEEIR